MGFKKSLQSKHQVHDSKPPKGGAESRHEGGFAEGEYGRGPTPYKRSHSPKAGGHSLEAHIGTAGRGDGGFTGGSEQNKGHVEDLRHPQSHGEFEALGTK